MSTESPFDVGSHSIVENLAQMRITPDSDLFRGIDLCTQFITYWDQDFNMVDLNRSLFIDGMVDHSRGRDLVMHHHISEFLPDLLSKGVLDDVMRVHKVGGTFVVDDYQFQGFNLKHSLKCTMTIAKISDYTVITGENISTVSETKSKNEPSEGTYTIENDYVETIENLYRTIDVLARRFSSLEQVAKDTCLTNITTTLEPLLGALAASKLDDRQRIIVDTMRQSIGSITQNYMTNSLQQSSQLTMRETEIANLIRLGKTTKEIAAMLCLSERTVESHRASIRKKLGIKGEGANLQSLLLGN